MYSGFLLKIGDYKVPHEFIESNTYKCGIRMQDLNDFTNANGVLVRNVMDKVSHVIDFEVPGPVDSVVFEQLMSNIRKNYIGKPKERDFIATFWSPEMYRYLTMRCYLADIDFTIEYADDVECIYDSTKMALLAYGGDL